ncbi:MAG: hypothetical protein ABGW74_04055, partial [Campylobacterales bacterium]
NELKKNNLRFDGCDISLAATMVDKLSTTIDILYYLMDRGEGRAFVIVMFSAKCLNVDHILKKEKRNTDILFEIDKEKSIYAIVCQDTKVDGGYRFAQRIMSKMIEEDARDIYLTELEVRTNKYDIKYIVFKLLESFIKVKIEGREKEIDYNSLT